MGVCRTGHGRQVYFMRMPFGKLDDGMDDVDGGLGVTRGLLFFMLDRVLFNCHR